VSRFLSFLLLSAALFAGEEVIASFDMEEGSITLQSGRALRFANHPLVERAIGQMEEGDKLQVEGKGVVVVSHERSEILLFADENEFKGEPIEAIELFAFPRSGSRHLAVVLRSNLPNTPVRAYRPKSEAFEAIVRSCGSFAETRRKLLPKASIERTIDKNRLALIALRAPRPYLESLYRVAALPFKDQVQRGFDLFLNEGARLPSFASEKNPLTNEVLTNPIMMRQLLLLQALFVERSAHKSLVIDFEQWRDDEPGLIARICAAYGCPHAPYFKRAPLDLSGQGESRRARPLDLAKNQELKIKLSLDEHLEKHFGFKI